LSAINFVSMSAIKKRKRSSDKVKVSVVDVSRDTGAAPILGKIAVMEKGWACVVKMSDVELN
jgi:hypothetical protein